ncbi:MAG: hypothetical protein ACRD0P_26595 [Stackebrandtia sp.]
MDITVTSGTVAPIHGASPLSQLETVFGLLSRGPHPIGLDTGHIAGLPARVMSLVELRAVLLNAATPPAARDAVWRLLVDRARIFGGSWQVAAAGMAVPGLRRAAARLASMSGMDRPDVDAEVLTGFLEAVARRADINERICARLCAAAYAAGKRAIRRDNAQPDPVREGFGSRPPAAPCGHPDLVLASAVVAGVISGTEAGLIGATRFDDVSLTDIAIGHEVSVSAVSRRRRSAEHRLVAWIATGRVPVTRGAPSPDRRTAAARAVTFSAVTSTNSFVTSGSSNRDTTSLPGR